MSTESNHDDADRADVNRADENRADANRTNDQLRGLLSALSRRRFFADRLGEFDPDGDVRRQFESLPLMTKSELVTENGLAAVCDLPQDPDRFADGSLDDQHYVRWHQTSGTTGHPIIVRDTAADWRWWMRCWDTILDAAAITAADTALMAFSFGPFIGFWSAYDALVGRGTTVIPGGGLSSVARVQMLVQQRCTVLFTTPTYALRLAAVADEQNVDLRRSMLRRIVVAGEPGGSVPSIRQTIQHAFDAEVIDHAGGSEVGPWGYAVSRQSNDVHPVADHALPLGLFVNEDEFVAEVMDWTSDPPRLIRRENPSGEIGELVLTPLGRLGCPVLRYRTGDLVQPVVVPGCDHLFLSGGILGRADDMVVIRGVNVFPSSVEAIVREVCPTAEFRVTVGRRDGMDALSIELGDEPRIASQLSDRLTSRLAMRVPVRSVAAGSLPTFEGKSRRWIDRRG